MYMACQMAATVGTLNDLERYHRLQALSHAIRQTFVQHFNTISTDSMLARFLCINRAPCSFVITLVPVSSVLF